MLYPRLISINYFLWLMEQFQPTWMSSVTTYAYGVYILQHIIYATACTLYGECLDRGRLLTKKLVVQGCTLGRCTFESFMVDTMIYYNITIFPFHSVTQSSADVCYIHRILSYRVWLIILLISWRVRNYSRLSFVLPGTCSHTWVSLNVRVFLSETFIPGFVTCMFMD